MSEILFQYEKIPPTTWAYLSSLLMLGLFFKFNRFWSVRNADLVLLILLAPGLLAVHFGEQFNDSAREMLRQEREAAAAEQGYVPREGQPGTPAEGAANPVSAAAVDPAPDDADGAATAAIVPPTEGGQALSHAHSVMLLGFVWLMAIGVLFVIRLLADSTMARRPLLEPNLTTGGLIFACCSLFVFLMANVITSRPSEDDLAGPRSADHLLARDGTPAAGLRRHGPGYQVMYLLPNLSTTPAKSSAEQQVRYVALTKAMAIASHLAIVLGMIGIGYWHFGNLKMGIGAATLYLMLPYTALMTGRVAHALPAAMLVWAVMCYRRPFTAGTFLGIAASLIYYPLFALPLWIAFYWERGLMRFLGGLAAALAVMIICPVLWGQPLQPLLVDMFGVWAPIMDGLEGVWGLGWDPQYRRPVMVAFMALSITFARWPAQKNLGTLLSCTAALMVSVQFWHGFGGGLFAAWYLPLLLLTVFRPNLEDRIALAVLPESWSPKGKRGAALAA